MKIHVCILILVTVYETSQVYSLSDEVHKGVTLMKLSIKTSNSASLKREHLKLCINILSGFFRQIFVGTARGVQTFEF